MPDPTFQAIIRRFWGDRDPMEARDAMPMEPIERYMQFRRLNDRGWGRIIRMHGPDGAQQYRDAMRELGKTLGLEG